MSEITKSKAADTLRDFLTDEAPELLNEEFDKFYDEGVKARAAKARKILKDIMDAAKNLRKVIQDDKVGRSSTTKSKTKKSKAKKSTTKKGVKKVTKRKK